jgi:hypothetical protein
MRQCLLLGLGILAAALAVSGCSKKEEAPAAGAPASTGSAAAGTAAGNWTPEALEELLAPIAIYPDVVLGHVLAASTNPQEVLDAGNWLLDHQDLSGTEIDAEASKLGLSPSVKALLQFPEVMDMLCMQIDWTTELGEAFTADQAAVLDAVQRLRAQAKDVGNLASSAQLKVETETQEGKEVITVAPPSPEVVYVPKYDPVAVYAPPPATIPPPSTVSVVGAAPGTTVTTQGSTTVVMAPATTTTTTTQETGHSTEALITTGLLAFGAGILINEAFDDDWDDYGPNYYHGGMYYGGGPYYPPPPYMYRPPYGGGYYPSHGYNRGNNYRHSFNDNTIIVNNGGNDYWKRNGRGRNEISTRPAQSPITAANPRRSDLKNLDRGVSDRSRQTREASTRDATRNSPAQGGYAGARPENKAARDRMVAKSPPPGVAQDLPKRPTNSYSGAGNRAASAGNRGYAGAQNRPATGSTNRGYAGAQDRTASRPAPAARPEGTTDRGRDRAATSPATPAARPQGAPERPAQAPAQRPAQQPGAAAADRTAFGGGGAQSGRAERQASQRGRSSLGGGSGGKARKPRR